MAKKLTNLLQVAGHFIAKERNISSSKWRSQLVEAVRHTSEDKRPKLIHQLCRELQINLYGRSLIQRADDVQDCVQPFRYNRVIYSGTIEILRLVTQTMLEDGDIKTFLRILHFIEGSGTAATLAKDDAESSEMLLIRLPSLVRFLSIFLDYVGESDEASLRFGILLCEAWDGLGNSTDLAVESLKKAKVGFDKEELTKFVTARLEGRPMKMDDSDPRVLGAIAMNFLHQCVMEPVKSSKWIPVKPWFERIVQAAERSRAANEVLLSLINVLTSLTNTPAINAVDVNKEAPSVPSLFQPLGELLRKIGINKMYHDGTVLRISPEAASAYERWSSAHRKEQEAQRESGERNLDWFVREQVQISRLFDARCERIMQQPKRGLRPNGYDHVEMRVSALRNVGVRGVVFRPEGYTFPDVGIEIIARRETPTLCVFKTRLSAFELDVHDEIVRWREHFERRDELLRMLEYVVVDMLYRIIAGPQELREKHGWAKTGGVSTGAPLRIPVRPFMRRLPRGFNATEEAQERAKQEMGWVLRPGMTFVSASVRNGQLEYDLPTQPIAIYSDEDLTLSLEED